ISRNRYRQLMQYLHVTDPVTEDRVDKQHSAACQAGRPVETTVVYRPSCQSVQGCLHVTIDESMVKFKGRLAFRQYLPSKRTKWGVKVWSLCESSTGYTWNFQVYTGR
ncbi:PiggyBac transposable element-derived protein 4, partial [Lamellibrachia satsuma]